MPQPSPEAIAGARAAQTKKTTLAAVLGTASLAALVMSGLTSLEGYKKVGYRDIAGIATACRGTIKGAVVGRVYTDAQCDEMDGASAVEHAEGVRRCTPGLAGNQLVAATLLTYNIGVGGYCGSTIARRFNGHDLRGGCDAFLAWVNVKGKPVRGLINRRNYERTLCLTGLPA
ncbi:lysozyme [Sphingomonas sp. TREG-RG-20F-R18-01]|uniref:lysozyme n=1 Tax=Sphingomonas sp. TREG-RG-20F-R18-01 TaxID=2914982 RepID=UPI001F56A161|nr:lysozyme [Sphingomonas sp. TREG-RG-20F-R18-01]